MEMLFVIRHFCLWATLTSLSSSLTLPARPIRLFSALVRIPDTFATSKPSETLQSLHQRREHQVEDTKFTIAANSTRSLQLYDNLSVLEEVTTASVRALEIVCTLTTTVAVPLFLSFLHHSIVQQRQQGNNVTSDGSDVFWSLTFSKDKTTNAERVTKALEALGPTFVKFGQALSSRPDVIPPSLALALAKLQDDMEPFDTATAKSILWDELSPSTNNRTRTRCMIESFSNPVAAASIGQVYKGYLSGYGDVAIKVQRPGVRRMVERDSILLNSMAAFVDRLPSLPGKQKRLINSSLSSATTEFMSRILEELDYRKEAANAQHFARLYSIKNTRKRFRQTSGVIVPDIIPELCTKNVLVLEWIEGTKLTATKKKTLSAANELVADLVGGEGGDENDESTLEENFRLVRQALIATLNQLLNTGVMHADPHGGNLLKVSHTTTGRRKKTSSELAYLDFGLISTIPEQVRDGLVCSVARMVFNKDVEGVAGLFGELKLLPEEVLADPMERAELIEALQKTMDEVLLYPPSLMDAMATNKTSTSVIPVLKFDKLLDGLTRMVPRFRFNIPPYFLNNARALGTLEGIGKALHPEFNALQLMYPHALNRLVSNPSKSAVVEASLQSLIRNSESGRVDYVKVRRLIEDLARWTGYKRRRVTWDILRQGGGRKLVLQVVREEAGFLWKGRKWKRIRVRRSNKKETTVAKASEQNDGAPIMDGQIFVDTLVKEWQRPVDNTRGKSK